jgi:hypothetical protein
MKNNCFRELKYIIPPLRVLDHVAKTKFRTGLSPYCLTEVWHAFIVGFKSKSLEMLWKVIVTTSMKLNCQGTAYKRQYLVYIRQYVSYIWQYLYVYRGAQGCSGGGTALQTGRSRGRFRLVSWKFFSDNPAGRTLALGSTQPLTEMSTRCISWG